MKYIFIGLVISAIILAILSFTIIPHTGIANREGMICAFFMGAFSIMGFYAIRDINNPLPIVTLKN